MVKHIDCVDNEMNEREAKIQILEAAIAEFGEKGFDGTRTGEIAKRAGVASGLLHYHFKTKENLYHEVLKFFLDYRVIDELKIFPYPEKLLPEQKLNLAVFCFNAVVSLIDPTNIIRFYHRVMADDDCTKIQNLMEEYDKLYSERYLMKIISDGVESGRMKVSNSFIFACDIFQGNIIHFGMKKISSFMGEDFYGGDFQKAVYNYQVDKINSILTDKSNVTVLPEDLKKITLEILAESVKINRFGTLGGVMRIVSKITGDNFEV
ncbi:MAG: TetR/AcrR family transcriptional regulator [Spirochaetes bacterium]|nr:TetR/AcrR family transcriptional regulator [Spirochaetota bacterium]